MKELIAHPERAEIQKAGDDEIQQLIDQQVGVIVPKSEVDEVLKNGGKVLNAKMLFKRTYEIVDGVERFKKWKGRFFCCRNRRDTWCRFLIQQFLTNGSVQCSTDAGGTDS